MDNLGLRSLLLLAMCLAACLSPALSLQCYMPGPQGGVIAVDANFKTPTPNPACLKYKLNGKWEYTITNLESPVLHQGQVQCTGPCS
jgi:hypothetical protein